MGTKKAYDALAAERAAREAEGIFEPTQEQRIALRRYRVLAARKAAAEDEMRAIASQIFSAMDSDGARALLMDGKNVVLISDVNRTVVDTAGFAAAFPVLAAQYAEAVAGFTTVKVTKRKDIRA